MYNETKIAVRKALKVGKILFSLGGKRYAELLDATSKIRPPTHDELSLYIKDGLSLEDAIIKEMKKRYEEVAITVGFKAEHGIAMLEYAALLEEIK
jgi:hypothetical protein